MTFLKIETLDILMSPVKIVSFHVVILEKQVYESLILDIKIAHIYAHLQCTRQVLRDVH